MAAHLDVLVNNAGVGGGEPVAGSSTARWRRIIDTNVTGTYLVTREAIGLMRDGGRIVNISSVLGRFGVPGYTAYCASKHGVIGFTRALALELAPRSITVNALCPGWVDTEMAAEGMRQGAAATGQTFDEFRERAARGRAHQTDHSTGGGRGARALRRITWRRRRHGTDLQHLRRPGHGLSRPPVQPFNDL